MLISTNAKLANENNTLNEKNKTLTNELKNMRDEKNHIEDLHQFKGTKTELKFTKLISQMKNQNENEKKRNKSTISQKRRRTS